MTQYTTLEGDKWDQISYRVYGTRAYVDRLIRANTEHVGVYIFQAGVKLNIPQVSRNMTRAAMPPWKRVL